MQDADQGRSRNDRIARVCASGSASGRSRSTFRMSSGHSCNPRAMRCEHWMIRWAADRLTLRATNGLERLNKEIKRRADAVGIFPIEASTARRVGAALWEAK